MAALRQRGANGVEAVEQALRARWRLQWWLHLRLQSHMLWPMKKRHIQNSSSANVAPSVSAWVASAAALD